MSDRRIREHRRQPQVVTARLAGVPGFRQRRYSRWLGFVGMVWRSPGFWLQLVSVAFVSVVLDASAYIVNSVVLWDPVRRRHSILWRQPAAIVMIPLAMIVAVFFVLVVVPIWHAVDARRRYIRWLEVISGRK